MLRAVALLIFVFSTYFCFYHMINAFLSYRSHKVDVSKRVKTYKGMSILVPCYNEAGIIESTVKGLANLPYPNKEVIFLNDGSKDETLDELFQFLDLKPASLDPWNRLSYAKIKGVYQSKLYPYMYVIDKENGGKADSLNAGIDHSSKTLVVSLDADSILDEKSLHYVNQAFQDPNLIAAGGSVRVLQGTDFTNTNYDMKLHKKSIVNIQVLDYLKGFFTFKLSLSQMDALAIISGCFGIFDREIIMKIGGYRKTIGEDIDVTIKLQNYMLEHPHLKLKYIPEAVCYTEAPENWRELFHQRVRWQKAFIDTFKMHYKVILKTFWKRSIYFFLLIEGLIMGLIASLFTLTSFVYILLALFNPSSFIHPEFFFYTAVGFVSNISFTITALIIARKYNIAYAEGSIFRKLGVAIIDATFFRLFNIAFVLYGTVTYFFNSKDWYKVSRVGNHDTTQATAMEKAN